MIKTPKFLPLTWSEMDESEVENDSFNYERLSKKET